MKKSKNKANEKGTLVISLDFELLWGVHDHKTKESFLEQVMGARKAVEVLLKLFDRYQIHATWGVVGMMMAQSKEEMIQYSPAIKPQYQNGKLSAYQYMDQVGDGEESDVCHYAHSLIAKIKDHSNQELASHTFSHYYCKAPGQNVQAFSEDLNAAQKIAKDKFGVQLRSLILPQNQFVDDYMEAVYQAGFTVVRGNPGNFAYNANTKLARIMRLVDTYLGVCGRKTYSLKSVSMKNLVNIKASTFFRKYNTRLAVLEKCKVSHIKREMKRAARHGEVYHLWWHPHNINSEKCFVQLKEIFEYYKQLQDEYGFQSKTMCEAAEVYQ